MNKYILLFLLLFTPVAYSVTENETTPLNPLTPDNPFKKLGDQLKLNCKDVGNDSCTSRFIAMAACSFAYGVAESDKSFKESLDIADELFALLMRGNGLSIQNMFTKDHLVKESIRTETIERVKKCETWTKKAVPKIVLERTGKPATPEFIEGATNTFGEWWLRSIEDIRKDAVTNYQKR